jgi:tRNA-dihydrouridine synthase B
LMGADPEQFGPAAVRLVEAGFDVVDINFGCPVKKVLGRCRGGFLLSTPKTALEIVSHVREALPPRIPVTVKMRRGLDDSPESADNFYTIFDGAFERGAVAVTVHGRTVVQRYEGPSNWSILAEIKRHAAGRTVLGSGDLFSAESCVQMLRQTGVDGLSVARGAIGNPWIFRQVQDALAGRSVCWPGLFEQREVLAEHFRLSQEIYGDKRSCAMMRKFGIKYAQLHPLTEDVKQAFIRVSQPSDWQAVLMRWYSEDLPGRRPGDQSELTECGAVAAEGSCEV